MWVGHESFISDAELVSVTAYLKAHGEIREILVSGGDPLTAPDSTLEALFRQLRETAPNFVPDPTPDAAPHPVLDAAPHPALHLAPYPALRVCTRAPVTAPERLGAGTIALFRRYRPLRLAVHINHSRELAPETRNALAACVKAGIPVLVQTVLLRGVNDDPAVLAELFRECLGLGLSPYYLFQLDLAPGTAHFRVPLKQGLALYRKLRGLLGKECPVYAVDLPGGGGKIRLGDDSIAGEREMPEGRVYLLKGPDGVLWAYPLSKPVKARMLRLRRN
jgi:lysine 2,3-aminomutase